MSKLRILKLIDQFGWAYFYIAKEQAKYSQHEILYKRVKDFRTEHLQGVDIVYLPAPNLLTNGVDHIIALIRKNYPKIKIIGAYSGELPQKYSDVDLVISISSKHYPVLKKMYDPNKVIFLAEGIDTEYFKRESELCDGVVPGWVGRPCVVKRPHILDKLMYPVKKQQAWGHDFFKEDRTLDHVKSFYESINCFVLTSSSECMPRVVLEAMSMGLPVIATDVGSLRMLLPLNFLTEVNPEERVIEQMNLGLQYFKKYENLYWVGCRNREYVEEYFSWKNLMPLWDNIFTDLHNNHIDVIKKYMTELNSQFINLEPSLKD